MKWERVILTILALTFFAGLWHGLPLTQIVADEAPNVGGVLRAMENKTLLPARGDVPYATVTWLLSYLFIGIYLVVLLPFSGFDLTGLKTHLVDNPHELYLVTRAASAVLALAAMFILYRLGKRAGATPAERVSIIALVLGNILIAAVFHTTKVWVVSTVATLLSIYFLYRGKVFWSVALVFLGFANFPMNFYAVAALLPALWLWYRKEKKFWPVLMFSLLAGFAVFAAVTAINWQNIQAQVTSIFTGDRAQGLAISAVARAAAVFGYRALLLFPLLLLPLGFASGIRDRRLFGLSLWYLGVYLVAISFTATWVRGTDDFLRYLVPVGFFLGMLLFSLGYRSRFVLPAAACVSAVYYIFTLGYLASPTTYNLAARWSEANLGREAVVIVSDVWRLQLPLNAKSAALLDERFCSTRCRETAARDLNSEFEPLVFDRRRSDPEKFPDADEYYLFTSQARPENQEMARFGRMPEGEYYSVDNRLGTYFDPQFFRLDALGENIYVYKLASTAFTNH